MDAGEYMPVALGLIFLKYLSDAFVRRYTELLHLAADPDSPYYARERAELYRVLENHDSYREENICWMPAKARWNFLRWNAKYPSIGKIIDEAMAAIEAENPYLTQVLPKGYSHPKLDKQRLGSGTVDRGNRTRGSERG